MVLREEIRRVSGWQEHHRRLLGRLLLILVATLAIDAVGTFLIYLAERHARGTDIHSIGDAFFFTTVQLLTVSSQIKNPFTPFGRAVDILLEVWAVLVVAGSAGAFASFLQDVT